MTVAGRVKTYTVLDANEVRDKLRDLNVEGRIEVDLTEIPNEFIRRLVLVFSGQEF